MFDAQTSDAQNTIAAVQIDVISDVVCPWCFIGKRRLEKALALNPNISVEVRYHPYFLNPWVPREGMNREEYLTTKFGSPDRYASIAGRVAAAAAAEGLTYAVDKMRRQPNTLDCHRLILWAQSTGGGAQMKQRLMDLYFTEGADLSDREVLVRAASDIGMDPSKTRERLASDADVEQIENAANSAKDAGIDGVPTFIIGGVAAITGAQSPEAIANAIEQIATNREQFLAEQKTSAR
jgi:predicted DsbA family dithiol-disulfide isomerase